MPSSNFELTPELQAKIKKFLDAYDWSLIWLADAGGSIERKERDAWASARREVPVTEIEEELIRKLLKEEAVPNPAEGNSRPISPLPIPKPE